MVAERKKGRKISAVRERVGKLLQTGRYEESSRRSGRMGKTQGKGGLLETVEESQDEVLNAESAGTRALESNRTTMNVNIPVIN